MFLLKAFLKLFHWHLVTEEMQKAGGLCVTVSKWARTWNLEQVRQEVQDEVERFRKDGWYVVKKYYTGMYM